jgi:hypothetical protein
LIEHADESLRHRQVGELPLICCNAGDHKSITVTKRWFEAKGDSYDLAESFNGLDKWELINALAESFNGLYKWELIYPRGPWRGLDDVEFATLGYVDWFNHRRLHGEITDDASYVTPAEFEAAYYLQRSPALAAVTQTGEQS